MHSRLEEIIFEKISPTSYISAKPFRNETILKIARRLKYSRGRTFTGTFKQNRLNTRTPKNTQTIFMKHAWSLRRGNMQQNKPKIIYIGQAVRERDHY